MTLRQFIIGNLRHFSGWRTTEKLVVLNIDDYGTIRLASPAARDVLRRRIPGFGGRMDTFDALENRQDLEALFDVVRAVHGADDRPAVVTAYALAANPDFSFLQEERRYKPEALPDTFSRLSFQQPQAYEGAWALWRQGIREGLLRPQFHGREHFNVPLIEAKLAQRDEDIQANLEVESMAGLRPLPEMPGVDFTHAFGLHNEIQLAQHRDIIADGLNRFEQVFGFRSRTFTPPAQRLHPALDHHVFRQGVRAIDKPFFSRRTVGGSKTPPAARFLGPPTKMGPGTIVRTLSFEPCSDVKAHPVGHALRQIAYSFQWRQPAIISSHRVNYAGHIDSANRARGLTALRRLLQDIVRNWPDARFVAADELVDIMETSR